MVVEYNTKKMLIIASIVTLVILSVYIAFFLYVGSKNKSISILSNEVDFVVQKEIRLRSIQSLIKNTEEERKKLNLYFVKQDTIVDFIETIEELAVFSGVTIEIASVSVDDIGGDESEVGELLRLNFEVIGTWQDLFYLLAFIESLPFEITLNQVNFHTISGPQEEEEEEEPAQLWTGAFGLTVVKIK